MDYPVHNPVVPFTTGLSQIRPGLMIHVEGIPTGNRFSINLKTGAGQNDDIAFHFNPRFDGYVVVRNTKTTGYWGSEERSSNSGFPFVMGQQFKVIILCQQHQFKVAVNGRHFAEFKHRLSYQSARYLSVEGSVSLSMISTDFETPSLSKARGASSRMRLLEMKMQLVKSTSTYPQANAVVTYPTEVPPMANPNSVYVANVPFPNIRNHKVIVQGIPQSRAPQKFGINFQSGPDGELFFRFAARMDERTTVRNTRFGGRWGAAEQALSMPFPFQIGVPYQLVIHVDQGAFRVELNGMTICTFAHRKRPLTLIRQIEVTGATSVTNVSFQ